MLPLLSLLQLDAPSDTLAIQRGVCMGDDDLLHALARTETMEAPFDLAAALSHNPGVFGEPVSGPLAGAWAEYEGPITVAGSDCTREVSLIGLIVAQECGRVVMLCHLADPRLKGHLREIYLGWVDETRIRTFNLTPIKVTSTCQFH